MALFKSEKSHRRWAIKDFPLELKKELKERCGKDKKELVQVAKELTREYVTETEELYKNKEFKTTPRHPKTNKTIMWNMSYFPTKLHADFKSCCVARGDNMTEVLIHKVKGYLNG